MSVLWRPRLRWPELRQTRVEDPQKDSQLNRAGESSWRRARSDNGGSGHVELRGVDIYDPTTGEGAVLID
jgi:hypothetical protein